MQELRQKAKELLETGQVAVVIGYESVHENRTRPFIARKPEDAEKLVFGHYALNNLATYLTRKDLKSKGKTGIVTKGCDLRAINMLIQESQIKREDIFIIGMRCSGVVNDFGLDWVKENLAAKCITCTVTNPDGCDLLIGENQAFEKPADKNLELIQKIEAMSPEERMAFWEKEFEKCIRCYACRQICPMCYCERCIADKTMPRWIESSASKRGNFAWNIIRAFHLSGRCIGCNECERACPVGIPLSLLNRKMAMVALKEFHYTAGMNPKDSTLIGTYDTKDKENFIK